MMEVYTSENKKFHSKNSAMIGAKNGRAKLTEEDVIRIRTLKKQGVPKRQVYEDYKDKLTLGSFSNTWLGYN